MQRKLGEKHAYLLSRHSSLAQALSQALGGSSPTSGAARPDSAKDVTAGATSVEHAVAAINAMLTA